MSEMTHPLPYASWESRGWWEGAELACVHGTGGTLGIAHSGATLILGSAS